MQVKRVDAVEAVAVYQEQTGYGKPAVKHDDHGHGHGHGKYFIAWIHAPFSVERSTEKDLSKENLKIIVYTQ